MYYKNLNLPVIQVDFPLSLVQQIGHQFLKQNNLIQKIKIHGN